MNEESKEQQLLCPIHHLPAPQICYSQRAGGYLCEYFRPTVGSDVHGPDFCKKLDPGWVEQQRKEAERENESPEDSKKAQEQLEKRQEEGKKAKQRADDKRVRQWMNRDLEEEEYDPFDLG